jgi:hypothetical protein
MTMLYPKLSAADHVLPARRRVTWMGVIVSLTLHALVLIQLGRPAAQPPSPDRELRKVRSITVPVHLHTAALAPQPRLIHGQARSILPAPVPVPVPVPAPVPAPVPTTALPRWVPQDGVVPRAAGQAASKAAPPPPTAEEWAFASRYTPRNGKAYRHSWAQQVRSRMGTAVEGPDQGAVRLRVEIAPDGSLVRLDTLWSTSAVAEHLVRQAMAATARWPAPPGGRTLIFERTIEFSPHAHDDPPRYEHDCEPEAPRYGNRFTWDGHAPPQAPAPLPPQQLAQPDDAPSSPEALADCLRQLPPDSIDAVQARDRRAMERWGWSASPLGR